MNRAELKEKARNQLGNSIFSNRWLTALLVTFIFYAIVGAGGGATFGLISLIVTGPLAYGVTYLFVTQARENKDMKLEDLFKGFSEDFSQNFLIMIMTTIFTFLWSLLFVIPGIVKSYAYSMAYYIKVDHPDYDWRKCLEESTRITEGHKMDLFILDLSFIGWYFVGILCFGAGVLWVDPYKQATKAQFYETIKM